MRIQETVYVVMTRLVDTATSVCRVYISGPSAEAFASACSNHAEQVPESQDSPEYAAWIERRPAAEDSPEYRSWVEDQPTEHRSAEYLAWLERHPAGPDFQDYSDYYVQAHGLVLPERAMPRLAVEDEAEVSLALYTNEQDWVDVAYVFRRREDAETFVTICRALDRGPDQLSPHEQGILADDPLLHEMTNSRPQGFPLLSYVIRQKRVWP